MAMNVADVLLLVNTGTPGAPMYEVVGSQRDLSVGETTEEIDVSSKDGRAKRVLAGRYGSTFTMDALYVPDNAAYQALRTANRNGELILIAVEEEGVVIETANALITDMTRTYPDQDGATISVAVTIDGEWTDVGS